ncbi:hypothetical protein CBM2609_B120113 [Cupriavidus taiwanensis]|uniref:Thioesterase domain-containing protein n=1 Tax=Cupriavidus taiwanensis TaxID=164546 RepID=A0A976B1G5_9BURK|nr:hypothetical protein CBM2604_B130113 [Cupriavidus taiwanensis]SOZ31154.1 hypothetical protein CBM2609_B120113 [Cupriavidus taiwanensis]SOZ47231.1 hypothetical protein CBM2610_B100113 [Cupriavidus taiwanensis]SOZ67179.1 hypothetical protein CBM2615_B190183 [Cupriavidus taiwanensis]SOZ70711.1 hypothetical protein CBM2613_B170150 [Cupriavidus taiwanensis]
MTNGHCSSRYAGRMECGRCRLFARSAWHALCQGGARSGRGDACSASGPASLEWLLACGNVISLADTCCGYGTVRSLPSGASGFTTVELKSNMLGTARDGIVICTARPIHKGRTTQVWDAEVRREGDNALIASFRNTQWILWPRS